MWPLTVCHVIISIQFLFLATSCHFQIAWNCSKFPYLHHFIQVEGNLLLWHRPHDPSPTPLWIPWTPWLLFYGEWKLLTACNSRERRQRPPSRKCPGFWPISSSFQQAGTHARSDPPCCSLNQVSRSQVLHRHAVFRAVSRCTVSLVVFLYQKFQRVTKEKWSFQIPYWLSMTCFFSESLVMGG